MSEAATCGTYQDVEAALAALTFTQDAAIEAADGEPTADQPAAVQQLHLSCCDIDDEAVGRIAAAISGAPQAAHMIESVNLGWNEIEGTENLRLLVQSLVPLTGLGKLDLNYNSISDCGATHVASLVSGSVSLKFLDLVKNSITSPGSQALASALGANQSLTALHLGMNSIGDEGLMHLAGALQTNHTLLTLDVESNKVGPDGVRELSHVLANLNDTLTAINLQDNEICDAGAEALAEVLETSESLRMLDIRSNGISCDGCSAIACSLRKSLNLSLDLDLRLNTMDAQINEQFEQLALSNCEIQVAWDFGVPGSAPTAENSAAADSSNQIDSSSHFECEELDGENYGEVEAALPLAEQTVERMLGIIPDEDDIAFDNATWYLQKQPELASQLWSVAAAAGSTGEPMWRCLKIFHLLLEQALAEGGGISQHQFELLPQGLVECCIEQLPLLLQLLQTAPTDFPSISSTFGVLEVRFGSLRLGAAELIADLIETQQMEITQAICASQLLETLLDHFFNYTWNSALHCCILRICQAALCCEDQSEAGAPAAFECLQRRLLSSAQAGGCGLLGRLVDEYAEKCGPIDQPATDSSGNIDADTLLDPDSAEFFPLNAVEANLVKASRTCGYMGAVVEVALMIHDQPVVVHRLEDSELETRWDLFDSNVLLSLRPVRDECLGGVPPTAKPQGCGQM